MSTKKTSKKTKKTVTTNVELKLNMDQVKQLPLNESISYKQLCEILDIKYYSGGGNAKDIQLSELSRYVNYEIKPNKKIVIHNIFETPVKKEYSYPVNTLYAECIKKILQRYLSTRVNDKGITYIYSQRLYSILGMINEDYIFMQKNNKKLREDIRVSYGWADDYAVNDNSIDFYIDNFFSRTREKFQSIIESSLKSLKSQKLLDYATSYCLIFEEKDENGNIIQYTEYTDDKQLQIILKVERSILLEMGLKSEYQAISCNRIKEYYEKTTIRAKEYFPNLKNMYRCFKIIYNLDDMQTSLTLDDIKDSKTELNQKVLKFINKQANKNYLSAMDNEKNNQFTETYTLTQHYLSDKLIKLKGE